MKKLLIITEVLFVLLSIVAPIRLNVTTPPQCGYNGSGTEATCISDCTLCNTAPVVIKHLYPSIVAYILDIKDSNNSPGPSLYRTDIIRNEVIVAILTLGTFFVLKRNQ
jgi:hypothetical protein